MLGDRREQDASREARRQDAQNRLRRPIFEQTLAATAHARAAGNELQINTTIARHNCFGDGKGFVFVSHSGEIFPGGFLPIVAGSVREDRLIEVYRNDPTFVRLRDPDRTNGKCGWCDFREMCGGSRARAYGFSDAFGSEPCCAYQAPAYRASLGSVSA